MPDTTWMERATHAAANILAETGATSATLGGDNLIRVLAIAWLEGHNAGARETMAAAEQSMERIGEAIARTFAEQT